MLLRLINSFILPLVFTFCHQLFAGNPNSEAELFLSSIPSHSKISSASGSIAPSSSSVRCQRPPGVSQLRFHSRTSERRQHSSLSSSGRASPIRFTCIPPRFKLQIAFFSRK